MIVLLLEPIAKLIASAKTPFWGGFSGASSFAIVSLIFCLYSSLFANQSHLITPPQPIIIKLEHASSPAQITWGLMQRQHLPWGEGMTFNFPYPQLLSFWMFNTLIDLSLAFLDQQKVIGSLHELHAHPEKMNPNKPISSYAELLRYPKDEIVDFFQQNSVYSSPKMQYAVEMSKGWFAAHGVKPGDVIIWNTQQSNSLLLRTLNIDHYISADHKNILIELSEDSPFSVSLTGTSAEGTLSFLDSQRKTIKTQRLKKNQKNIFYTEAPIRYLEIRLIDK